MAYSLSERAPSASNLTAKNRVWGFFENSNRTRPANRRKPSELRRKIRPTTTKTASGIPYWPSRDPIEERGGVNLYGFVENDGVNQWDILGLACCNDRSGNGVEYDETTKCCENNAIVGMTGEGDTKCCPAEYRRQAAAKLAEMNRIRTTYNLPFHDFTRAMREDLDSRFPCAAVNQGSQDTGDIFVSFTKGYVGAVSVAAGGINPAAVPRALQTAVSFFAGANR